GETLRLWAQTYPRDPVAPGLMSGFYTAGTGQFELMIEKAKEAIAISPDAAQNIPAYFNVVWGYISVGRTTEAEQALRQALARGPDIVPDGYHLAFLKGDTAGMEREIDLAKAKPNVEDALANLQALVLARAGRIEAARQSAR